MNTDTPDTKPWKSPSRGTSDGLKERAKNARAVTSPVPENSSENTRIGGFLGVPSTDSVSLIVLSSGGCPAIRRIETGSTVVMDDFVP
jgi:hypothetical protein